MDIMEYLNRQRDWSTKTFGDGKRAIGITDHIKKELSEILEDPYDLSEWIDVIILALDGYWRYGGDNIMDDLVAKQDVNFSRTYEMPESDSHVSEHKRLAHE